MINYKDGSLVFYRTKSKMSFKPILHRAEKYGMFIEAVPAKDQNRTSTSLPQKGEKVYDYEKRVVSFLSLEEINYLASILDSICKTGTLNEPHFLLFHKKTVLNFSWDQGRKVFWLRIKPLDSEKSEQSVYVGFSLEPRKSNDTLTSLGDIRFLKEYLENYLKFALSKLFEERSRESQTSPKPFDFDFDEMEVSEEDSNIG